LQKLGSEGTISSKYVDEASEENVNNSAYLNPNINELMKSGDEDI